MKEQVCDFCTNKTKFQDRIIKGYEPDGKKPWAYVPCEPATFGHVIVVSGKHYLDICHETFSKNEEDSVEEHMKDIMRIVRALALKMKKLEHNGKKCEKVYMVSECETPNLHLHFHLIPRFQGDNTGHMFLFEKELEELRWKLENDASEDKNRNGYQRIGMATGLLDFHRDLIRADKWVKSNKDRIDFIEKIRKWFETA